MMLEKILHTKNIIIKFQKILEGLEKNSLSHAHIL